MLRGPFLRPGFLLRLGTSFLCNIGSWTHSLGVSLLVLRLSNSVLLLGAVVFASSLPNLLVTPVAGALADRHDARRMVLVTEVVELASSLSLLWIAAQPHPVAAMVMVSAVVRGVATAFRVPAQTVLLYGLVEAAEIPDSLAANSVQFNIARIGGPLLAAALVERWGLRANFGFTAATYFISIVALILLPGFRQRMQGRKRLVWLELLAVARYAIRHPTVAGQLLLAGVSALFGSAVLSLAPYFSRDLPGFGANGFGSMLSLVGAGALLTSFALLVRPNLRTVPLLVGAVAVNVLGFLMMSVAWSGLVAGAAMALLGASMTTTFLVSSVLLQRDAPLRLRGRVAALHVLVTIGVAPLGGLVMGACAQALGSRSATGLAAVAILATLLLVQTPRLQVLARAPLVGAREGNRLRA